MHSNQYKLVVIWICLVGALVSAMLFIVQAFCVSHRLKSALASESGGIVAIVGTILVTFVLTWPEFRVTFICLRHYRKLMYGSAIAAIIPTIALVRPLELCWLFDAQMHNPMYNPARGTILIIGVWFGISNLLLIAGVVLFRKRVGIGKTETK